MRELQQEKQQEKKAIESQLKSIRATANSRRHRSTVLDSFSVQPQGYESSGVTQRNSTPKPPIPRTTLQEPIAPAANRSQSPSSYSATASTRFVADSHHAKTRLDGYPSSNSRSNSKPSGKKSPAIRPYPTSSPSINLNPNSLEQASHRHDQTRSFPDDRPVSSDELAATVKRLQQQSEFYVHQFNRLQFHTLQTPQEALNQSFRVLEAHAQHINQLSEIQESALVELKAMAEKVGQDWAALERMAHYKHPIESNLEVPPICEYEKIAVPQIVKNADGIYVLTARSIDLFQAEREANLTAQALRYWADRDQYVGSSSRGLWSWLTEFFMQPKTESEAATSTPVRPVNPPSTLQSPNNAPASTSSRPGVRFHPKAKRSRHSNSVLGFGFREGVALFIGAILIRITLNLLLSTFPFLWTPAVVLLATPAMIAVYQTSRTPRSGMAWVYRLLILMLGLLVGGRL